MKKVLTVVFAVLTVLLVITAPFLIKKKEVKSGDKSVIITVWHTDAFDGGKGSRCSFLREIASGFSKRYENVYFLVSNYSVEGLKTALQGGNYPDIVSFGGCDLGVSEYAKELKISGQDGGLVGNKRFAVAYLKGGYFKIVKGNGDSELIISDGEYFSSETACLFSNAKAKSVVKLSSQDAYTRFLIKDDATLIGTQRDIVRLRNLNAEFTATPIERYNDLFQYFSITADDKIKCYYASEFINYALSNEVQQKLNRLCMFSTTGVKLYGGDEIFSSYEKCKNEYTFIPFSTKDNFNLLKTKAYDGLVKGEDYDIIVNSCKNLINVVK